MLRAMNKTRKMERWHESDKVDGYGSVRREQVEEVAERVTEAVTSWMTVESSIELYASWEEWNRKAAELAESKTAEEKRAHTN